MSRARALALPLALAATGCLHRLDTNAPGHVSLEPPADLSQHEPAIPLDPGDQSITLHPGAFIGGGASVENGAFLGSFLVGAHLNVLYGIHEHSAIHFLDFLVPDRALGAGFGFSYQGPPNTYRFVLELQGHLRCTPLLMCGLAGGVAWEPETRTTFAALGPQLTASAGPLFIRVAYLRGRVAPLQFGMNLDPTFTLVWSR